MFFDFILSVSHFLFVNSSTTCFLIRAAFFRLHAEDFLKHLFEKIRLPSILGSEEELRKAWSNPLTRRDLLQKLEGAGCPKDDLRELQKCIEAENCDLFDVLEYVAYAKAPVTHEARVNPSREISTIF
tara:strand:+ start:611 stop:994 length:384 start_codon:yes stop_codon:yes gene_type:complete